MAGVPIAVKDNMCITGREASCASKILKGFVAPYDAEVICKLKNAGAIILGRTNMDEFAMGSSTETSAVGYTANPWNKDCVPGGSSGGSAATVASFQTAGSLGSDTGGSIRQPAALCGVVGIKPTYGRVSRYGLIAFASSLDQIGTFSRDVTDCAILMNAISGHDAKDSTSIQKDVPDFTSALDKDIKGLKIGIPAEYFAEGIDPEVEKSVRAAVDCYKELGAEIKEISLPHTQYAVPTYYIVATAEASSNLARYDGVQYGARNTGEGNLVSMYEESRGTGFGDEVKRRILLGTYALSSGYYDAYYLKALKVRRLIHSDFEAAFNDCDCILTPTSPSAAFRKGEKTSDPLQMYLADIYTISANLAGIPGLSVPCGLTTDGLPIGMQLLGKAWDEATLLNAARAFEKASGIDFISLATKQGLFSDI